MFLPEDLLSHVLEFLGTKGINTRGWFCIQSGEVAYFVVSSWVLSDGVRSARLKSSCSIPEHSEFRRHGGSLRDIWFKKRAHSRGKAGEGNVCFSNSPCPHLSAKTLCWTGNGQTLRSEHSFCRVLACYALHLQLPLSPISSARHM